MVEVCRDCPLGAGLMFFLREEVDRVEGGGTPVLEFMGICIEAAEAEGFIFVEGASGGLHGDEARHDGIRGGDEEEGEISWGIFSCTGMPEERVSTGLEGVGVGLHGTEEASRGRDVLRGCFKVDEGFQRRDRCDIYKAGEDDRGGDAGAVIVGEDEPEADLGIEREGREGELLEVSGGSIRDGLSVGETLGRDDGEAVLSEVSPFLFLEGALAAIRVRGAVFFEGNADGLNGVEGREELRSEGEAIYKGAEGESIRGLADVVGAFPVELVGIFCEVRQGRLGDNGHAELLLKGDFEGVVDGGVYLAEARGFFAESGNDLGWC